MLIVFLLLFAVGATCNNEYGWKNGRRYEYEIRVCGFIFSGEDPDQSLGFGPFLNANLDVIPISKDKLSVTIHANGQSGQFVDSYRKEVCAGNTLLPSDKLVIKNETFSGEPFEINLKKGLIAGLTVSQNITNEELILVKTIANALQLDLQGENCDSKSCQLPTDTNPKAVYTTMETSKAGLCETQYEVSPFLENSRHLFGVQENGKFFQIVKRIDSKQCQENTDATRSSVREINSSNTNSNHIVIAGSLEQYIVQSSVSTNKASFWWLPQLPGPTTVTLTNLTLTSTHLTDGHYRNVSNPQAVSLIDDPSSGISNPNFIQLGQN